MSQMQAMSDSPVMEAIKQGSRGDGNWPGYECVYQAISRACAEMGARMRAGAQPNEFHIATMADLGSGHEERMKARLQLLRAYGWL